MCKNCEINPVYEFTNKRKVCKTCFIRWFDKKFFYTIRRFNMVCEKDILGYSNKTDFRNVVLENLLNIFITKAPVRITKFHKKGK